LWDEITASDILRIGIDGRRLAGKWPVTPGIPLHLELHRARPTVQAIVHNHPRYSGIFAVRREAPPVLDQTGALTNAKTVVVDEFDGEVNEFGSARRAVELVGDADIAILGGHGVLVIGDDASHLFRRAYAIERRCRRAWEAAVVGGCVPFPAAAHEQFGGWVEQTRYPGFWESIARRELRLGPNVLD